jgi:hypothetical protein
MKVAISLLFLASMAFMGLYTFKLRSMACAYGNPGHPADALNRQAMDQLTREIRQAKRVLSYTTNSITVRMGDDGQSVTHLFKPVTRSGSNTVEGLQGLPDLTNSASNDWSNKVKTLKLQWRTLPAQPQPFRDPYRYYDRWWKPERTVIV